MRKTAAILLFVFAALNAFGHAGEVHKYMGTVTAVDGSSFSLKTRDGATLQLRLSDATTYAHADGRAASRSDLAAGRRVVATIAKDGKTATSIKLGAQ